MLSHLNDNKRTCLNLEILWNNVRFQIVQFASSLVIVTKSLLGYLVCMHITLSVLTNGKSTNASAPNASANLLIDLLTC